MTADLDLKHFSGVGRLFPLPGVVLFPHVVMPLHVFEPRYRQLTEDALASDGLVTMVQSAVCPSEHSSGEQRLEAVGCLGRILDHERLPDGRFNYLLLGRKRVRIVKELAAPTLYRQAELEVLDDVSPGPISHATREVLVGHLRAILEGYGPVDPDIERLLCCEFSLGVLTDVLGHALSVGPEFKQELLAQPVVEKRAEVLCGFLGKTLPLSAECSRWKYPPTVSPN